MIPSLVQVIESQFDALTLIIRMDAHGRLWWFRDMPMTKQPSARELIEKVTGIQIALTAFEVGMLAKLEAAVRKGVPCIVKWDRNLEPHWTIGGIDDDLEG